MANTQNDPLGQITLSGQISPEDVRSLASQGIKTIINNRPDHEETGQPTSDDIAQACQECGIAYAHIAFAGGMMNIEHVQDFAHFFNQTQRPLHIFCRTGNRSNAILTKAIELDLLDD